MRIRIKSFTENCRRAEFECPKCNEFVSLDLRETNVVDIRYCPYCGADLGEE